MSERSKRIDETLDRLQITKEDKLRTDLGFIFPSSYKPSGSLTERIKRASRMDANMIQEAKVRDDLNDESIFLFFTTLAITSILQIIIISLDPSYQVENPTIFVIVIFAFNFSAGYSFLFIVSVFMNILVPTERGMSRQDVLRVCSYPFPLLILNSFFALLSLLTGSSIFTALSLISLIYFFAALIVTLRVALETNNLYAIFGVIVPYTVSWIVIGKLVSTTIGIILTIFT